MAKKAAEARRRSIVEAVRRGASQRATARAFGVGLGTVQRCVAGRACRARSARRCRAALWDLVDDGQAPGVDGLAVNRLNAGSLRPPGGRPIADNAERTTELVSRIPVTYLDSEDWRT